MIIAIVILIVALAAVCWIVTKAFGWEAVKEILLIVLMMACAVLAIGVMAFIVVHIP